MKLTAKMRVLETEHLAPPREYVLPTRLRLRFEDLQKTLRISERMTRNWSYSGRNACGTDEQYARAAFKRIAMMRKWLASARESRAVYRHSCEAFRLPMANARARTREVAGEWALFGLDPYRTKASPMWIGAPHDSRTHAGSHWEAYQDIGRRLTYYSLAARLLVKITEQLRRKEWHRDSVRVSAAMLGELE